MIKGMGGFYVIAGINHFIMPQFYIDLIPPYLPAAEWINYLSGITEIVLGLLVFSPKHRKLASYGIIAMLLAFIPAHIYFIELGSCIDGGLCVPEWIGYLRLIVIHPLLIYWAWKVSTANQ